MQHKKQLLRMGVLTALCLMTICLGFGAGTPVSAAQDQQSKSGTSTSSQVFARNKSGNVQRYWTPERLKAAAKADITLLTAPNAPKDGNKQPVQGTQKLVAPALPSHLLQTHVAHAGQTDQQVSPNNYSYPFPFWRFEVSADYRSWPYSTFGRVFFTDAQTGGNYSCSGSAINSANKSVIETAGHCVIQEGSHTNWYVNWIFCPAYKDGTCQLGVWYARQLWSRTEWANDTHFEYDLGEAVAWPDGNGTRLVDAVGGQGGAWNYNRNQWYYAFGYPAQYPFDGNRLIECIAPFATTDDPDGFIGLFGPYTTGIGCDMNGGSSGGPWLIGFGSNGGYINGHNDYKYGSQPLALYSPYYGSAALDMFNHAQAS